MFRIIDLRFFSFKQTAIQIRGLSTTNRNGKTESSGRAFAEESDRRKRQTHCPGSVDGAETDMG